MTATPEEVIDWLLDGEKPEDVEVNEELIKDQHDPDEPDDED